MIPYGPRKQYPFLCRQVAPPIAAQPEASEGEDRSAIAGAGFVPLLRAIRNRAGT